MNVAWLSDILLGNLDALKQLDSPKYQQYNLPTPFRLDYTLVPHLMGKFVFRKLGFLFYELVDKCNFYFVRWLEITN